ncbi:predicted protein [Naegleria gruberi]|uniref:Predicted protein n=1 Tax=Naegleria gruberi TaxID=5762 RepID=D2V3I3_NAEGR|nr:uncharacterized protein NAEGRDRAFT_63373 [Naegleria gruberi]EFC48777.1 predicted protein [Naegleria gruberi]|eukprot:XP_002681521.1 predicted protein [Naegleria gruberi strain NEG-M]
MLLKKETSLENIKGDGIFLKGSVKKGQVLCLYPGLVYDFSDPIFFQSIGNMFINQRSDYCRVDGNDRFISKIYFKSYANRDNIILSNGQYIKQCDSSWLNFKYIHDDGNVENYWKIRKQYSILNHLNIGHYINSPVSEDNKFKSNVMYFEYDFLYNDWPYHLRQYIPNVFYKQPYDSSPVLTKSILLISLCDIESQDGNIELFANYLHLDS